MDLERRLTGELPEAGETEQIGVATLRFDGTIASLDGPKQKLVSDVVPITTAMLAGKDSAFARRSRGTDHVSPLMARLFLARPDLRERMIALGYVPAAYEKVSTPLDLPPFTFIDLKFEKQETWIGS